MLLAERVAVSRRFQRAIRIDSDLGDPLALEGFVCPPSSAMVLEAMAQHLSESGQGAFTWTGPYGSGKSSLVIALSALLGKDDWCSAGGGGLNRRTYCRRGLEGHASKEGRMAGPTDSGPSGPPRTFGGRRCPSQETGWAG